MADSAEIAYWIAVALGILGFIWGSYVAIAFRKSQLFPDGRMLWHVYLCFIFPPLELILATIDYRRQPGGE